MASVCHVGSQALASFADALVLTGYVICSFECVCAFVCTCVYACGPCVCLSSQHIDGINLFGLISIVSLVYCAPAAVFMEGSQWAGAWTAACDKMGQQAFIQLLAVSGIFYHLYNQVVGQPRTTTHASVAQCVHTPCSRHHTASPLYMSSCARLCMCVYACVCVYDSLTGFLHGA